MRERTRAAADETPTVFDFALWLNDFKDIFSQELVLWTPSAAAWIILRALRVVSREFEYTMCNVRSIRG